MQKAKSTRFAGQVSPGDPCGSNSTFCAEIAISKSTWGGPRANSGGARPGTGGARAGTGGRQPGSGRPRKLVRTADSLSPAAGVGRQWYVMEIRALAAPRVLRSIAEGESRVGFPHRSGFRAVVPMMRDDPAMPARLGVLSKQPVPMFPGYAFVEFDADKDEWQTLLDVDGVMSLFMRNSSRPDPVRPYGVVEWLLSQSERRLKLRAPQTRPIGSLWRVADGPFTDFPATVLACDGIVTQVSVKIFGRETPVNLHYDALEAM